MRNDFETVMKTSSLHFLCWLKENVAKERAFRGGGKNPVHHARQLAERRNPLRLHRSAPLPCYGRRIFSFTPHVAFTSLQPTGTSSDIFYYHTNHLGSTAYVTDNNATITQGFLYAPFGEITTEYDINFGYNVLPKYSFNAKELDEETGMYYYEARYYKPPVFTSRDAMFEKYFWMTPYAYCANNPVKYVDPSGCEFGDYYDENGNWVFNDGINDGRIYVEDQENGVFMGPLKQPLYRQVGTVTSVELTFTGEATNSKNKDNVDISKAEGTLSMIQHCDDGNDYVRFSFDATSGDYGNGSLENGQYSVGKGWRRSEKGYLQHDFGFCFPIIPGFETDRSELLIHPDGNKPGTKGCIGINSDLFGLKDFYKTMNLIIDNYGNIPLTVDILNNVNNNGSKSSTNKLNE